MEMGLSYRGAMTAALAAARETEAATARLAHRAEGLFESALVSGGADVEAAAERFRTAHRAHVDAMTEVAELEAELGEDVFEDILAA